MPFDERSVPEAGLILRRESVKASRRAARMFKVAASQSRLAVLLALEERERNTSDVAVELGESSIDAISRRLTDLRHAGLVDCKRKGQYHVYDLTDAGFRVVEFVQRF